MNIGICKINLRLPENSSLKGKRQVVKSITSRVSHRFNVAIAEVDDQDLWQSIVLGTCCVSNDKKHSNEILSSVVNFISGNCFEVEMLDYEIEIIHVF